MNYMKNQQAAFLGVIDKCQRGAPIGKRFVRKVHATYPRGRVIWRLKKLEHRAS